MLTVQGGDPSHTHAHTHGQPQRRALYSVVSTCAEVIFPSLCLRQVWAGPVARPDRSFQRQIPVFIPGVSMAPAGFAFKGGLVSPPGELSQASSAAPWISLEPSWSVPIQSSGVSPSPTVPKPHPSWVSHRPLRPSSALLMRTANWKGDTIPQGCLFSLTQIKYPPTQEKGRASLTEC